MQAILLYWFAVQHQTNTLDGKYLAYFTWNSAKNGMNLVFFLKATGSGGKMANTKVVRKNTNGRHSEAKG